MKKEIVLYVLIVSALNTFSQSFVIPEQYNLVTNDDCIKYEKDIFSAVDWLISTPLNEQQDKRKETYNFLMSWLSASSGFSIYLSNDVTPFISDPDMKMIYLGGIARYLIETKNYNDELGKCNAGIDAVIAFYSSNKSFSGDNQYIEQFIEMKNNDELDRYLRSKMHIK